MDVEVTFKQVMELASRNNPFRYDVVCRMLQARQQVAQAKAGRGFKADVYASIGFTGSDRTFKGTYRNLRNREAVSLGISIPILNWGKGRGLVELARRDYTGAVGERNIEFRARCDDGSETISGTESVERDRAFGGYCCPQTLQDGIRDFRVGADQRVGFECRTDGTG